MTAVINCEEIDGIQSLFSRGKANHMNKKIIEYRDKVGARTRSEGG